MGNEYFWQVPGQGLYARSMHSSGTRAGASGDGSQRAAGEQFYYSRPRHRFRLLQDNYLGRLSTYE
jgi:hypothetical protein